MVRLSPAARVRKIVSDPVDQDICTKCALSWKIVVLERWLVIAVSLIVGGDVRLIKPAKLYSTCARKTLQTQRGRTHGARRGHGSVPLSHVECRHENWITTVLGLISSL